MLFILKWKIIIKFKTSLYKIETKILLSEDNIFSKIYSFFLIYEGFVWNSSKDDFFLNLNILLSKFSQFELVMIVCIFIIYSIGKKLLSLIFLYPFWRLFLSCLHFTY